MARQLVLILTCILATASLSQATQASDTVTLSVQDEVSGATSLQEFSTGSAADSDAVEPIAGGDRDATILWHRHFEDPIYTSCGIIEDAEMTFAGNWLNPIEQIEAIPLLSDGSALWTSPGTEFYTDAGRQGWLVAAVDINTSDSTAVISGWMPGSSTPVWSHTVHPCRSMTYAGWASRKPIQVADDGSTVAVALVMYTETGEQRGHLFAFDSADGSTLADWEFPAGNVVATALSSNGRFVAMAGWPTLYVYDLTLGTLRWSGPIGSGNDALAISADGEYVSWGWTTLNLRRWNGSSYAYYWSHTPGSGYYLGQCAFSPHDEFAVAWDNGNNMVNEISVELFTLSTMDQLWHYDYQGTPPSTHVDITTSMVFSPDGNRIAVGSWGGSFPEIHVFDRNSPDPIYTLDTPGSIFDIDIVDMTPSGHYVTACGKGVHAGTSGRGGDFYAIAVSENASDLPSGSAHGSLTSVYPNPLGKISTISFALEGPSEISLRVYDLTGRMVRELDRGIRAEGTHELHWRGDDSMGRPLPAGVYFLRLTEGSNTSSRKIVLVD